MSAPEVGVVVAVRDGERYVAEAIDSILGQTAPPAEVVVVDDGSRDATPEILAGYGDALRVVRHDVGNQFVAMNRGVAESRAPVLAFLDHDDLFPETSLAVRLERLTAPDAPDVVAGRTEQFVSPELGPDGERRFRFDRGPASGLLFQTMLMRRSVWDRVGPLRTDLVTSANLDWISRARLAGLHIVEIPDVVARRRLHSTNIGITRGDAKKHDLLDVVRAHHRRTRGSPGG